MQTVLISRAVTVKSKVTPLLRARLGAEAQKAIRDVEQEMERFLSEIEKRRALGKSDEIAGLERKLRDLQARKDVLTAKLKDIAKLSEGQEVTQGQVQGFYEVKVGDVWSEIGTAEIVLEDGRVVAIREGNSVTVEVIGRETAAGEPER
ncbi:MAG TPA: hypothetical protein GX512_02520 [Firmicutes bacterium]|nr:hypothetical protein [Candidatus Fermentithermobacillaceae bacterium]